LLSFTAHSDTVLEDLVVNLGLPEDVVFLTGQNNRVLVFRIRGTWIVDEVSCILVVDLNDLVVSSSSLQCATS
jgi:hypothetical protein